MDSVVPGATHDSVEVAPSTTPMEDAAVASAAFDPEAAAPVEAPREEDFGVSLRPPTPDGLGAARVFEAQQLDHTLYMRFLRMNTMAATKRMPRNSMARFHLALVLYRLGDLTRAHVEFQRALECAKSWIVMYPTGEIIRENPLTREFCARIAAHVVRVSMELQGDRYSPPRIVEAFRESFGWANHMPHVWNDLALMHLQAGEHEAARAVLEAVVARWPGYTDALCNLALAFSGLGQVEQATRCLQAVIGASRSHAEAINNYATILIDEQREPRAAVAMLRYAIDWDALQPAFWSNLALAYARLGRGLEACKALARACDLAPDWESIWLNASSLLLRFPEVAASVADGSVQQGEEEAPTPEPAELLAPEATPPGSATASVRRSCLRAEEVEARIEAQADVLPDGRAWAALAATRMSKWEALDSSVPLIVRQETRDDCRKAAARAINAEEDNIAAWMQLGECYLQDGDYTSATVRSPMRAADALHVAAD